MSLEPQAAEAIDGFKAAMDQCKFHTALTCVWELVSIMNKYVDTNEPWALAKEEARTGDLGTVLYELLEGLRTVAGLIWPVMPETSTKMIAALGIEMPSSGYFSFEEIRPWGQIPVGIALDKPPILFPRVEVEKKKAAPPAPKPFKAGIKR